MVVQPFSPPCLPPYLGSLLLLHLFHPTLACIILVSMKDLVRNNYRSRICVIAKSRTKRIILGELGAHIHRSSIISSLINSLKAIKTSMQGQKDWSWNIWEEPFVDFWPVNSWVSEGDIGVDGLLDGSKDGGGMGPDRKEIRTDHLLHLNHPLLLGFLRVIDVQGVPQKMTPCFGGPYVIVVGEPLLISLYVHHAQLAFAIEWKFYCLFFCLYTRTYRLLRHLGGHFNSSIPAVGNPFISIQIQLLNWLELLWTSSLSFNPREFVIKCILSCKSILVVIFVIHFRLFMLIVWYWKLSKLSGAYKSLTMSSLL